MFDTGLPEPAELAGRSEKPRLAFETTLTDEESERKWRRTT
jgi:hypothetical protein